MKLGLDFGTCFSFVSMAKANGDLVALTIANELYDEYKGVPTVFYYEKTTGVKIGVKARELYNRSPQNGVIHVKKDYLRTGRFDEVRILGSKEFRVEDIVIKIIEELIELAKDTYKRKDSQKNNETPELEAITVAVPVLQHFEEYGYFIRNCVAKATGLNPDQIHTIEEPVAVALSYLTLNKEVAFRNGDRIVVYDLGGGTFDAAILEYDTTSPYGFKPIRTSGNTNFGGTDLDDELFKYIMSDDNNKKYTLKQDEEKSFMLDVERCKIKLSREETDNFFHMVASGAAFIRRVARKELEEIAQYELGKATQIVVDMVNASPDMNTNVDYIILSGGASQMPVIARNLKSTFPRAQILLPNTPDRYVSFGAAIAASTPPAQPKPLANPPPPPIARRNEGVEGGQGKSREGAGSNNRVEEGGKKRKKRDSDKRGRIMYLSMVASVVFFTVVALIFSPFLAGIHLSTITSFRYDSAAHFSEGRAAVGLNGRYGFIDERGIEVIPLIYDQVFAFDGEMARVVYSGNFGIIDRYGEVLVPFIYNYISEWSVFNRATGGEFTRELVSVRRGNYWGFINLENFSVLPIVYDAVGVCYLSGVVPVSRDGRWGFMDSNGNEIVPLEFDWAGRFTEGRGVVRSDGKYGFVDARGEEVIPFVFGSVNFFSEHRALVSIDGYYYGFIGIIGESITPKIYTPDGFGYPTQMRFGFARVRLDGKVGVMDRAGNVVIPFIYDDISPFHNGIAAVRQDGLWGFIDIDGNIVISPQFEDIDWMPDTFLVGYVVAQRNGRWGIIDGTGRAVVQFLYDDARPFSSGFAAVKLDGLWGFVDESGRVVIDFQFDATRNFGAPFLNGGIAIVQRDGMWGAINNRGRTVIPFRYDQIGPISEGKVAVSRDGRWGFIRIHGIGGWEQSDNDLDY